MKLGTKINLLILLTVTVTMSVHGYLSVRQDEENALNGARIGMRGFAQAVGAALRDLYGGNRNVEATRAFAREVAPRGNVHGLVVYDLAAQPVAISSSLRFPQDFPELDPEPILKIDPKSVLSDKKAQEGYLRDPRALIYYRIEPIVTSGGELVGAFVLARHGATLMNSIADRRDRIIVTTAALVLGLSLLVWIIVQRSVARPIRQLIGRIREIGGGQWQQRIDVRGDDEVAVLGREFNSMSEELQNSYRRLMAEVSENRKLELELRRSERLASVGQLAAGLAHEIGTPLNIISGRAEQLMRRPRSVEEMQHHLQIIRSQSERIAAIVRQLLDFSRRREPVMTNVDLTLLISKVKELFEPQLKQRKVQVEMSFPEFVAPLRADADLLQQVFINLFANALHALPGGGLIRIRIEPPSPTETHGPSDGLGQATRIYFEDNGVGIAPANRARVFDPFFTTKDVGEGSGLGLSVTFGIIKDHGGEISVESEIGKFTRFKIELPNSAPHSSSAPPRGIL